MRMLLAVLVLVLGCFISAPGFAQSIGPDGRPLQTYSGSTRTTPIPLPPSASKHAAPAPAPVPPPTLPPAAPASTPPAAPNYAAAPAPTPASPPTPPPAALVSAPAPIPPPIATVPVPIRPVAAPLVVPRSSTYRTLSDSEVATAIERGHRKNPSMVGLSLLDMQTALLSGIACTLCGQSGYYVTIYTPVKWIEFQSAQAHRELRPFTFADVTPEMREPILRVMALPSRARYITGQGLAGASNVTRVVLADHTKQEIIQPLTNEQGTVESNSALRSINYTKASASFSLNDVDQIRGEDEKGEFFVVVVGSTQNKYFKVKTRMFKALF